MVILGLSSPISWDQSAAIIKNGQFLACAEEERFVRIKHAPRFLPENAIEFCLKFARVKPEDVDAVAVAWRNPLEAYWRSTLTNLKELDFLRIPLELYGISLLIGGLTRLNRWLSQKGFRLEGNKKIKYYFIPHHLAHAASTFRCSGFKEANIITIDGQGEDDSGSIWYGQDKVLKKLKKINHHQSVGVVYHGFTEFLGFKPHSQEGKVTGLAAYGKKNLANDNWWTITKDSFHIKPNWFHQLELYGPPRKKGEPLKKTHKDLAFTVQRFTEMAGQALAQKAYNFNRSNHLCLAGGVALNCSMNSKIRELPFVKKVFIQPAAADNGTAIGAALEVAHQLGENADFAMEHAYWGPEYSNEEIKKVLLESKTNFKKVSNISRVVAQKLAQGKIIGWFQGRSEIGPRALGNRSILAHPGLKGMKDKINQEVKHRENWRPFAPSILNEAGYEYFENYCPHPFMVLSFKATPKGINQLSQSLHVDKTGRIQSVTKKSNPKYYQLIKEFAKNTGIPAVLNTSFNDLGEPLVNSPREALKTFFGTGIDLLAMGDFIVEK